MQANVYKQSLQPHQGMILTDKDAGTLENNSKFKSVELNSKLLDVGADQNTAAGAYERPKSPEEI